jgi:hypothetical protein
MLFCGVVPRRMTPHLVGWCLGLPPSSPRGPSRWMGSCWNHEAGRCSLSLKAPLQVFEFRNHLDISKLHLFFDPQRDAPLGALVGWSPRASEGFVGAFRGSIERIYPPFIYQLDSLKSLWCSAPEQDHRRSHESTLVESRRHVGSICSAQPPSRVTSGVSESRRVDKRCPADEQGH